MSLEREFLDHLPLIESVIRAICRRNTMFDDEAEDFAAEVKLKLVDDDYAVLRKFQGKAGIKTYLTVVIQNLFRDYLIKKHGKWRHSNAARRLGPVAMRLETLLYRDGRDLEEAITTLRNHYRVAESEDDLRRLAAELPWRQPRRFEGEEELEKLGTDEEVDARLRDRERRETVEQTRTALERALAKLGLEDRMLLKMFFQDGLMISRIAPLLGEAQRALYSRKDRCLRALRRDLEAQGLAWPKVAEILGWKQSELSLELAPGSPGNRRDGAVQEPGERGED